MIEKKEWKLSKEEIKAKVEEWRETENPELLEELLELLKPIIEKATVIRARKQNKYNNVETDEVRGEVIITLLGYFRDPKINNIVSFAKDFLWRSRETTREKRERTETETGIDINSEAKYDIALLVEELKMKTTDTVEREFIELLYNGEQKKDIIEKLNLTKLQYEVYTIKIKRLIYV